MWTIFKPSNDLGIDVSILYSFTIKPFVPIKWAYNKNKIKATIYEKNI